MVDVNLLGPQRSCKVIEIIQSVEIMCIFDTHLIAQFSSKMKQMKQTKQTSLAFYDADSYDYVRYVALGQTFETEASLSYR